MTPSIPDELLNGVIRRLDPVEVFLFGSQARGEAGPDSDIDLYVVIDDEGSEQKLTSRAIAQAREDYSGAVDILVARKSTFERRKTLPGALAYLVSREGRSIYAR